jgi:DNA polymerase-1
VLLLKLLREERPTGIAFARDLPKPTLRHQTYAEYKGGRAPMPDQMRPQWKRLDQLIAALGAPTHSLEGYEADDMLATLAHRLRETEDVLIVTGDRDLFQTIGPRVKVLFLGARGKKPELVDEAVVRERYGIEPIRMPTLAALLGEDADNLEGVPGVGLRTAQKLVATYGTAESLLAHLDAVQPAKVREALALAADRVRMNEKLATLHDCLALETPLVKTPGNAERDAVTALFEELEFKSLVPRLHALFS